MKRFVSTIGLLAIAAMSLGCSSQDIPPAHKGRKFDKTGALALWVGGNGFEGPVLGPGTYFTGCYPEIRMVECAQRTVKESLTALTKDGVQFSLDVYVSYGSNCDEEKAVQTLLTKLAPEGHVVQQAQGDKPAETTGGKTADPNLTITADQVYRVYIRPAIGEAVRESVSPYIANDVNGKREEIFDKIKKAFDENLSKREKLVVIYGLNLSNLDFPEAMDKANAERAAQAILKDKAIAEMEKVKAEIETAKLSVAKAEVDAQADAKRIDVIGAAYKRNPEYVTIEALHYAGEKGNMILLPANGANNVIQLPSKK